MIIIILLILVLLIIGSFSNNVITSMIFSRELDLYRSFCSCGSRKLTAIELIPIVSYFMQSGKCRSCKNQLSVRYLLVELAVLALGLIAFYKFGLSIDFFLNLWIIVLLLILGVVDLYTLKIPNTFIILFLITFLVNYFFSPSKYFFYNFALASIVTLSFLLLNKLSQIKYKTVAIGYGDIKLIGALILFFDIPFSLIAIWLSSLFAVVGFFVLRFIKGQNYNMVKIPFGFFLFLGFTSIILFRDLITNMLAEFV